MEREDFIDLLTEELSEDPDNRRLNRILEAADAYAESVRMEHTDTSLYIREKHSGRVHRIGTDIHDHLVIDNYGRLHYMNLQNGDGCYIGGDMNPVGGYDFMPNVDDAGFSYDPLEGESTTGTSQEFGSEEFEHSEEFPEVIESF